MKPIGAEFGAPMTERRRGWRQFWLVNGAVLAAGVVGYPLMLWMARHVGGLFRFCFFHDVCHLYCATCGGTRATALLLSGQIGAAVRSNAAVVWSYALFLAVDGRAFLRLCRGQNAPYRLPRAFWVAWLVSVIGYALLRDVCLVAFQWDWVGDFLR